MRWFLSAFLLPHLALGQITFVGVGTTVLDQTTNSVTETLDVSSITGLQQNDLVLFFITVEDNDTITSMDGFDEVCQLAAVINTDSQTAIFRKFAAASETTYTFTIPTPERWLGHVLAYRGVDQTTPIDVACQEAEYFNDGSPAAPAVTTVTDGAWVVTTWGGLQSGATHTEPTDYTERIDFNSSNIGHGLADMTVATAGMEDPGDWTGFNTGADGVVFTFGLRPAAPPGLSGGLLRRLGR